MTGLCIQGKTAKTQHIGDFTKPTHKWDRAQIPVALSRVTKLDHFAILRDFSIDVLQVPVPLDMWHEFRRLDDMEKTTWTELQIPHVVTPTLSVPEPAVPKKQRTADSHTTGNSVNLHQPKPHTQQVTIPPLPPVAPRRSFYTHYLLSQTALTTLLTKCCPSYTAYNKSRHFRILVVVSSVIPQNS